MNEDYLVGGKNKSIRYYFYVSNGLGILNEFRNLGLAIFAIYFTLKLTNPLWILVMGIISTILLGWTGYIVVHHISRVREWLNTKFGSHYAIKNFDYTKGTYELLVEINKKLDKLDK